MLAIPSLIAVAIPERPGLMESISYQVVGLLVVFTALGSIWFLMEVMGFVFRTIEARKRVQPAATPVSVKETLELPLPGVSPEVIAVITAAAHASLQAGEHIVAIHPLGSDHDQEVRLAAWSSEGRRQIFAGRKVR